MIKSNLLHTWNWAAEGGWRRTQSQQIGLMWNPKHLLEWGVVIPAVLHSMRSFTLLLCLTAVHTFSLLQPSFHMMTFLLIHWKMEVIRKELLQTSTNKCSWSPETGPRFSAFISVTMDVFAASSRGRKKQRQRRREVAGLSSYKGTNPYERTLPAWPHLSLPPPQRLTS